jgi:predicted  nucleic acid-binding Zn-ribbon protein
MKSIKTLMMVMVLMLASASLAEAQPTEEDVLNALNGNAVTKALGITKVTKEDAGFSAKIDAIDETVYLFFGPDGNALNAAIVLSEWKLGSVATFSAPVVIASTADNSVSALPTVVQAAVSDSLDDGNLSLKAGVNLFSGLSLGDSTSVLGNVFTQVLGAPAKTVPLSGPIGADVLSAVTSGKVPEGAQLSGMSLSFTLDYLRPQGLNQFVNAENLTLTLVDDSGSISLSGSFDLNFTVGGKKVSVKNVNVDSFSGTPAAGSPFLSLSGDFPGIPDALTRIPNCTVKDLGFGLQVVANADGGKEALVALSGKATLHEKEIDVDYALEDRDGARVPVFKVTSELTLNDFTNQDVPVVGGITLADLEYDAGVPSATLTWGDEQVEIAGVQVGDQLGYSVGINKLSLSTFAPSMKGTLLDGVELDNAAILLIPSGGTTTIAEGDLPAAIKAELGDNLEQFLDDGALALKEGTNFFADVNVSGIKALNDALSFLGMDGSALPIDLNLPPKGAASTAPGFKLVLPEITASVFPSFLKAGAAKIVDRVKDGSTDMAVELPLNLVAEISGGPKGKEVPFTVDLDLTALANKELVFTGTEAEGSTWSEPFGIPFVSVRELSIDADLSGDAQKVRLSAVFAGSHSKGDEVDLAIDVENGSIADVSVSLPKSKFGLDQIDALKNVPGVNTLSISAPAFSLHSFSGTVSFDGVDVDVVAFKDSNSHWSTLLHLESHFTIADILHIKNPLLEEVKLPDMKLVLASKPINQPIDSLPEAVQATFGGGSGGTLQLDAGVSMHGTIDPAKFSAGTQKMLSAIGIHDAIEITGTVDGIFGGSPGIRLLAAMDSEPKHSFTFIKAAPDTTFSLLLEYNEQRGAGLGFDMAIQLPGGDGQDPLIFDVDMELMVGAEGVEVRVSGDMRGFWNNAIGVKGLKIGDVYMSVGVMETGSFEFALAGKVAFGGEEIDIAGDMVISPEALFLPTAIGIAGKIKVIPLHQLHDKGNGMAKASHGKNLKGKSPKGLEAEIRNFEFCFMSPGATLPAEYTDDFNLTTAGMGVKGELWLTDPHSGHDRKVGALDGWISDQGYHMDGEVEPFSIGPVHMDKTTFLFQAGLELEPELSISGGITIGKGKHALSEKVKLTIQPSHFLIDMDTKIGGMEVSVHAESGGRSTQASNDFVFSISVKADFTDPLKHALSDALKGLKKMDTKYKQAQQDVANAKKKVDGLQKKIDEMRKKVKVERAKTDEKFEDAKHKVDSLNRTLTAKKKSWSSHKSKRQSDLKHVKLGAAAKEEAQIVALQGEITSLEASIKVAKGVLNTVEKGIDHTPIDLDPRVASLIAEKKTADAALDVAKGTLSAAQKINDGLESAAKEVLKAAGQLKINELILAGSLKGMIPGEGGQKVTLTINGSWGKHKFHIVIGGDQADGYIKAIAHEVAKEIKKVL